MKIILPIACLLGALILAGVFYKLKPEAAETVIERPITSVEVLQVQPESLTLTVRSQGTVLPKTESSLSAEVSGTVIEVATNYAEGASFKKGDILLKIDPADYLAVLAARKADLAAAELNLAQEQALAAQAKADWESMGSGQPSDLTLRKPQLAQAKAQIESADAALKRAERDLQRTEIKAPYDGRILSKSAALGQYLSAAPATVVAQIYATDSAEVRLPISIRETHYLEDPNLTQKPVHLSSQGPTGTQSWSGLFTRYEGTINTQSRLLYAVAEIENPFESDGSSPAMLRGLFVDAEIEGRTLKNAYSIPQYALRGSDTVYILNPDDTLSTRKVQIAKSDTDRVIISSGLEPGELVVVSAIAYYVEGMPAKQISNP